MRGSAACTARSSSMARSILSSVGTRARLVAVEVELGHGHAVGLGQAVELVGRAEAGVVAGLGERLGEHVVVERAGVGEALPAVDDDPDADALRLGRRERLDLALVDPHLGVAARAPRPPRPARPCASPAADDRGRRSSQQARDLELDTAQRRGAADGEAGDPQGRDAVADGHALAVLAARARAGPWRSRCRRRRCCCSTSGPLPMRLPSRSGSVISPSSIRYASVMPNTKSPVAVLTWPPPSWAT